MLQTTAVVIGGGATGAGVLRDLSLRGVPAVLVEQGDLAHGTSSRFHGLLHSGARYAVTDPHSARECILENAVLRRIGRHCVEEGEGLFVSRPQDDPDFERRWVEGCAQAGIPAVPVAGAELARLEPALTRDVRSAYRVPDASIDGFRLVWQNAEAACRRGGQVLTYTRVTGIEQVGGRVQGVRVRDLRTGQERTIGCQVVVNAAGAWVGELARLAGLDVPLRPDRGALVAFNHRFTSRVVNRLHKPADGDIFVPHGSITILGTTSSAAAGPEDTTPRTEEVLRLLAIGRELFEGLGEYRILRAFCGTRPLLGGGGSGRQATRGFAVVDHRGEGLAGLVSVAGGKLTTYRLMARAAADQACGQLGVSAPCRTADEPLVEEPPRRVQRQIRRRLPAYAADVATDRQGPALAGLLRRLQADPDARQLVCECEMVTRAEVEETAALPTTHTLDDLRRRTRLGMGTCQGSFCTLRAAALLADRELADRRPAVELMREFLQARWRGVRPVLWGKQVRSAEILRGIYLASLNLDGGTCP